MRSSQFLGVLVCSCLCFASFLTITGLPAMARAIALPTSASVKSLAQTPLWTQDKGASSLPATDTTLLSSPPLSAADRALVRWCLARYGVGDVPFQKEEAEKAAEKAARHFFDAMPRTQFAQLVRIRKALYRGTRAYTSVAFVLAYHGIDFERNMQRVIEAIPLRVNPPTKLITAGFKEEGADRSGAWEVSEAVETLYPRHRSAAMLRSYLRAPVDGHLAEDWWATIGTLLLAYPADVLKAASAPEDMKRLVDCARESTGDWSQHKEQGDYSKLWRVIRRLELGKDVQTVQLARRFRQVFVSASGRE